MRLIIGAALALGATVSACAAVSGLNEYSSGSGSDDVSVAPMPEAGGDDTTTNGDDASPPGDDSSPPDATVPADAPGEDASTVVDARQDRSEVVDAGSPDAYVCSAATCNGCCTANGQCSGGNSVSLCGTGGEACLNCSAQGACNDHVCGAPVQDSGGPQCTSTNVTACTKCAAVLYTACCKSGSCGCQWTGFAPCQ